ncbi:hypothetical protein U1Q18_013173 [Sarracenia purpurea var. burkii]
MIAFTTNLRAPTRPLLYYRPRCRLGRATHGHSIHRTITTSHRASRTTALTAVATIGVAIVFDNNHKEEQEWEEKQ